MLWHLECLNKGKLIRWIYSWCFIVFPRQRKGVKLPALYPEIPAYKSPTIILAYCMYWFLYILFKQYYIYAVIIYFVVWLLKMPVWFIQLHTLKQLFTPLLAWGARSWGCVFCFLNFKFQNQKITEKPNGSSKCEARPVEQDTCHAQQNFILLKACYNLPGTVSMDHSGPNNQNKLNRQYCRYPRNITEKQMSEAFFHIPTKHVLLLRLVIFNLRSIFGRWWAQKGSLRQQGYCLCLFLPVEPIMSAMIQHFGTLGAVPEGGSMHLIIY